jgi:hypothetical protein
MALSILESIRKLIRQDTNKVGQPVGNLYGAVQSDIASLTLASAQTWLSMQMPGRALPSLAEFLEAFADNPSSLSLEVAETGVLRVAVPPTTVQLLRTMIQTDRTLMFALQVSVPTTGAAAAVYVNGTLLRTVSGLVSVPLSVPAGTHTLYILTNAPSLTVTAPPRVMLVGEQDRPQAPQWISVTTGYLDQQAGTAANRLRWVSDSESGGYRVLRREPVLVGNSSVADDGIVLDVSDIGEGDTYVLVLQGDHTEQLAPSTSIVVNGSVIGVVVRATLEGTDTAAVCRVPLGVQDIPNIVGGFVYTGAFGEIARVARASGSAIGEYVDGAVTAGVSYEYALQATGLVDETAVSPLSTVQFVTAGDVTAPGPITNLLPTVLNRTVTAKFVTPADLDYAGVNVYLRREVKDGDTLYNLVSASGAVLQVDAVDLPVLGSGLTGYTLQFGLAQFNDLMFSITANTTSTITLSDPLDADLLAALNSATPVALSIYRNIQVKTHAGAPSRDDELTFVPIDYGKYYFATYDRSSNEQSQELQTYWEYTPADDAFTAAPVVAIRQLSETEQSFFSGYEDSTRYAIIELWAIDPSRSDRFEGVTVYYQRMGQDAHPVVLTPIPLQDKPFPYVIQAAPTNTTADAQLDNPSGTRTRFVLVDRTHPQVRIWTANAEGLTSDITTYVADLDDTPSVSVSYDIVPFNNTVKIVVIADDDTRAFTWQLDASALAVVDTRTVKRVEIDQPLLLGQLRTLRVVPYWGYHPTTPTDPGEPVVLELVRTPRSSVAFDSKDAQGNRSVAATTVTYSMVPAPQILYSGTGTVTNGNTLTVSGTPWTPATYVQGNTTFYYAILRPAGLPSVVRRVINNTNNTLTTNSYGANYTSVPFEIVDGAVVARQVAPNSAFVPQPERVVLSKAADFELEFFATKNGSYQENVRRVRVDADSLPSLQGFGYTLVGTQLQVGFGSADDDATTWEAYEKKGGWPTTNGQVPSDILPVDLGTLDRTYLRFSGSVDQSFYTRSAVGLSGGTWYAVAVPKNSFGEPGIAATAQYVVDSVPDPALTNVTLTPTVGTANVAASWAANAETSPTANVTITAVRADNPSVVVSAVRQVNQSYTLGVDETIVAGPTDLRRTWNVSVTLAGGNTITRSVTFFVQQPTGASVTLSNVSAAVYDEGACFNQNCSDRFSASHSRLVNWVLRVDGVQVPAGSPYLINLEVAYDAVVGSGTVWYPVAYGLNPTDLNYVDVDFCKYVVQVGGTMSYFTYRVSVTDLSGTPLGVTATAAQVVTQLGYCSGSPIQPF